MPDPETWRWLIGGVFGGLGAVMLGVGYIARFAYKAGVTLTSITDQLAAHSKLHDQHTANHTAHDGRIRNTETALARHSGQLDAL